MKRFRVRIVHELEIEFDDDRATEKSARHVAERNWNSRAFVGELGVSKTLGKWTTRLVGARVDAICEEEENEC